MNVSIKCCTLSTGGNKSAQCKITELKSILLKINIHFFLAVWYKSAFHARSSHQHLIDFCLHETQSCIKQ